MTSTRSRIDAANSAIDDTQDDLDDEIDRATDAEGALSTRIDKTDSDITLEVARAKSAEGQLDASLVMKLGRDENDQVVSMINASADQISLRGNRLIIDSNNFQLDGDGHVYIVESLGFKASAYGENMDIIGLDGKGNPLLQHARIDLDSVSDWYGDNIATENYVDDAIASIPDYVTTSALDNKLTNYINDLDTYGDSDKGTTFYYSISHSGHVLTARRRAINTSDERLKVDILPLDDLTDIYMSFDPISYHFNPGLLGYEKELQYGLSAQKIEKAFKDHGITDNALVWKVAPDKDFHEDVYTEGDLVYHLDKDQLHAMHIQMIQKQQHEIESLKLENFQIKGELDILKQKLKRLEEKLC